MGISDCAHNVNWKLVLRLSNGKISIDVIARGSANEKDENAPKASVAEKITGISSETAAIVVCITITINRGRRGRDSITIPLPLMSIPKGATFRAPVVPAHAGTR